MLTIPNLIKINCLILDRSIIDKSLKYIRYYTNEGRFPTKINRSVKINTMSEIKVHIMRRLGLEEAYTERPKSREHLLQYEPKLSDLPPRTINNSFIAAMTPLSTDSKLRDKYVSMMGSVRYGRLMEDMDLFAVYVCHQHLHIPNLNPETPLPYTFVTILVDKIDFTDVVPLINNDVRISGHVSCVGNSSIEVIVWLETVKSDDTLEKITKSVFLMAARNATNTKAAPVNQLIATNDYEAKILQDGVERKNRRTTLRETSLFKVLPTQEEQNLMHANFIKTIPNERIYCDERILPNDYIWMDSTKIVDIDIVFPQSRNAHNKIFGGFLMRKAYENSIIVSSLLVGYIPTILHISHIVFHQPVEINSILKMTSFVTYTEKNYIQVTCITENRLLKTSKSIVTNTFHYTYLCVDKAPNILPKTYQENVWNLIGKRELNYCLTHKISD